MQKYDIEKVVGEGSFGKALLCRRKADKKKCIIKQIALKKMSRKEAKQTEQESTLLSRLQHPNIVSFWEAFHETSKGCFCIVMEYADGGDLSNYIKARKGKYMSESQLLQLFVQITLAMKHVHDRKILHRDLKPGNIFLTSTGMVKLGDFGIARVLRNTGELASTQIGTPYFMSPEQMENKKYSNKSDVWSLGCVLYEMACLKVPFDGSSMKQLIQNILHSNPSPLPSVFSKDLRDLARDTLSKNPRDRPAVNAILAKSVMRDRIKSFLNETMMHREFSHTILHGQDVMDERQAQNQAVRAQVLAEANAKLAAASPPPAAPSSTPPVHPKGPSSATPSAAAAPGGGAGAAVPRVGARIPSPGAGAGAIPALGQAPAAAAGLPLVRAASPRQGGPSPRQNAPNLQPSPRQVAQVGKAPLAPIINVEELARIRQEAKKNGLVVPGAFRGAPSPRGGPVEELERLKKDAREKLDAERRAREQEKARAKAKEAEKEKAREAEKVREKARLLLEEQKKERAREQERVERDKARLVEKERERLLQQREKEKEIEREKERARIQQQREREREKEKEKEMERERDREREERERQLQQQQREREKEKLREKELEQERERAREREKEKQMADDKVAAERRQAALGAQGPPRKPSIPISSPRNEGKKENKLDVLNNLGAQMGAIQANIMQMQGRNGRKLPDNLDGVGNQLVPLNADAVKREKSRSVTDAKHPQSVEEAAGVAGVQFVLRKYIHSPDKDTELEREKLRRKEKEREEEEERARGNRRGSSEPAKVDDKWLANLQNDMGALKAQVDGLKLRSPRSHPIGQETQAVLQVAGKAAPIAAAEGSVPVAKAGAAAAAAVKISPRGAVAAPPAAAAAAAGPTVVKVEKKGVAAAPAKKVQKKGSEKGKAKVDVKPKAPPKSKEEKDAEAAAALAERKNAREKSRNELREFLKQQREQIPAVKPKPRNDKALRNRPEWVGVGAPLPGEGEDDLSFVSDTSKVKDEGDEEVDDDCWEEEDPPVDNDEDDEEDNEVPDEDDNDWGSTGDGAAVDGAAKENTIEESIDAMGADDGLQRPFTALEDTKSPIEEDPEVALSQLETRRMGDMNSVQRSRANAKKPSPEPVSKIETSDLSFGTDELVALADGLPASIEKIVEEEDDDMTFAPDEEEEELTEEAAMEYSKMLANMQALLEDGSPEAVTDTEAISGDEDFDEDQDDLLHMSAILEIDNEDEQSVMSIDAVNAPHKHQKGSGRYGDGNSTDAQKNGTPEGLPTIDELVQSPAAGEGQGVKLPQIQRRSSSSQEPPPVMLTSQSVPSNLKLAALPMDDGLGAAAAVDDIHTRPPVAIGAVATMTVFGLPMPLSHEERKEVNVDSEDTYAARVESIRVFLEEKLGVRRFVKAYRLLKSIQEEEQDTEDEDALLSRMEKILGAEGLQYLDIMFQLITIEEKFQ